MGLLVVARGADALIVQGDLVLAAGLDLGAGLGDAGEAVPIKTACCGAAAGGEGEDAACVGCDQEAGSWGLACEGDGRGRRAPGHALEVEPRVFEGVGDLDLMMEGQEEALGHGEEVAPGGGGGGGYEGRGGQGAVLKVQEIERAAALSAPGHMLDAQKRHGMKGKGTWMT